MKNQPPTTNHKKGKQINEKNLIKFLKIMLLGFKANPSIAQLATIIEDSFEEQFGVSIYDI